jgi:hypothetical protein
MSEVNARGRSPTPRKDLCQEYKEAANKGQRSKVFQEGDLVMVYLRKGCLLASYWCRPVYNPVDPRPV